MPPRPSEIAAQKRNAKKKEKVAARQVSSGAEVVTPDIADDIADSKLQRSSKKKALERKGERLNPYCAKKLCYIPMFATVIYAILMDWRSGNPPSSSQVKSFNATVYISVYKAHEATLTRIFEGGKKKYHALMARLYKAVCVSDNVLLPSGALSNFDYLDLSAMSED
ncbi:uncharacterized protein F5891DRAFT_1169926 [Suillus fuscotomentosus]|uniref:DUF6532 domain-containing protein n=1 Tax=Suillus fuscotomentosus TaxID=1912939 RepID=A0AAD4EHN8_9AGAM|nr:uncharacterized protein F5891DRAFT_1169926 [Suillus fuscotomentosus]KAG1906256.1 hypothetical protein F5891DRAFT_1169926 [Suillus fuscotomentosus]